MMLPPWTTLSYTVREPDCEPSPSPLDLREFDPLIEEVPQVQTVEKVMSVSKQDSKIQVRLCDPIDTPGCVAPHNMAQYTHFFERVGKPKAVPENLDNSDISPLHWLNNGLLELHKEKGSNN